MLRVISKRKGWGLRRVINGRAFLDEIYHEVREGTKARSERGKLISVGGVAAFGALGGGGAEVVAAVGAEIGTAAAAMFDALTKKQQGQDCK